jgi:hypothetical protein
VIDVRTLREGGQHAGNVARWIADFVGKAQHSLDLAHFATSSR